MKKKLAQTKVTVKLRKSDYRIEWYLIVESYPVFKSGSSKPSRVVEALNRIVTTPIWDKSRTARTTADSKTYKPKRDINGIIQCKSEIDQEACIYADGVRKIRQKEYDTVAFSHISLNNKRGFKINYIRVINVLQEMGFFNDENNNNCTKKDVFEVFGKIVGKDLSSFQNDLSTTNSASNSDMKSILKIFEDMLEKQKEINTPKE